MRILLDLLLLCFNADVILAQAVPPPGQAGLARPPADFRAKPSAFAEAVVDCEQMWIAARNMPERVVSTCRRPTRF
jgi:hypothetical protein